MDIKVKGRKQVISFTEIMCFSSFKNYIIKVCTDKNGHKESIVPKWKPRPHSRLNNAVVSLTNKYFISHA